MTELRLRWPRYVGGIFDGQDCPAFPANVTVVQAHRTPPLPAFTEELPPATTIEMQVGLYRQHLVPFSVGERALTIVAYADPELDPAAVAWRLLTGLVKTAGLDDAP